MSDRLTTHTATRPTMRQSGGSSHLLPAPVVPLPLLSHHHSKAVPSPSVTKTVTEPSDERTPQKRAYHRQVPHE